MKTCPICNNNHPTLTFGRALHTFFCQSAKRKGVALLGSDMHDLSCSPIRCTVLLPLGWMDTRGTHFALVSAQHPTALQGREQTQFRFIFDIDIRTSGRMLQQP
jgi:hypothetical protein